MSNKDNAEKMLRLALRLHLDEFNVPEALSITNKVIHNQKNENLLAVAYCDGGC